MCKRMVELESVQVATVLADYHEDYGGGASHVEQLTEEEARKAGLLEFNLAPLPGFPGAHITPPVSGANKKEAMAFIRRILDTNHLVVRAARKQHVTWEDTVPLTVAPSRGAVSLPVVVGLGPAIDWDGGVLPYTRDGIGWDVCFVLTYAINPACTFDPWWLGMYFKHSFAQLRGGDFTTPGTIVHVNNKAITLLVRREAINYEFEGKFPARYLNIGSKLLLQNEPHIRRALVPVCRKAWWAQLAESKDKLTMVCKHGKEFLDAFAAKGEL